MRVVYFLLLLLVIKRSCGFPPGNRGKRPSYSVQKINDLYHEKSLELLKQPQVIRVMFEMLVQVIKVVGASELAPQC